MQEAVYRTTRHPKLPDTFKSLRAQATKTKTTDPVQDWLDQTSLAPSNIYGPALSNLPQPLPSPRKLRLRSRTVNTIPLQPIHGNRLHPPSISPPPSLAYPNRKRKMPDGPDIVPRQSVRIKKNLQSISADDKPDIKGRTDITARTSRGQRKVANTRKQNHVFDLHRDTPEEGGSSSLGSSLPNKARLVEGAGALEWMAASRGMEASTSIEASNHPILDNRSIKLPMEPSTPSRTSSSPSKKSGALSKGPIVVNKRERLAFMEPCITFRTLLDTKKSDHLTGKLWTLWKNLNWYEQQVIPSEFKVRLV